MATDIVCTAAQLDASSKSAIGPQAIFRLHQHDALFDVLHETGTRRVRRPCLRCRKSVQRFADLAHGTRCVRRAPRCFNDGGDFRFRPGCGGQSNLLEFADDCGHLSHGPGRRGPTDCAVRNPTSRVNRSRRGPRLPLLVCGGSNRDRRSSLRARINGSEVTRWLSTPAPVTEIALDPADRKLYWRSPDVMRADLDTRIVETLTHTGQPTLYHIGAGSESRGEPHVRCPRQRP